METDALEDAHKMEYAGCTHATLNKMMTDMGAVFERRAHIDGEGKYRITLKTLYLVYAVEGDVLLKNFADSLRAQVSARGYEIVEISAILTDESCNTIAVGRRMVHIALNLRSDQPKFRITGLKMFEIGAKIPQVFTIKDEVLWRHVVGVCHPRYVVSFREHAIETVDPEVPKSRVAAATNSFEKFRQTNGDIIQRLLLASPNDANDVAGLGHATKHWCAHLRNAGELADYFQLTGQAAVFHNIIAAKRIVPLMQVYANREVRPCRIILCVTRSPDDPESPDVVDQIYRLAEEIVSGSLANPAAKRKDCPISLWRPHVFIFANFHPCLHRFDYRGWSISLQERMGNVGHLLVPATQEVSLTRSVARFVQTPPNILTIPDVQSALIESTRFVGIARTFTVEMAAAFLFGIFSPKTMKMYWRAGYEPVIYVVKTYALASGFATERLRSSVDDDRLPRVDAQTSVSEIIGKNVRLGNIIISSVRLTPEEHAAALQTIGDLEHDFERISGADGGEILAIESRQTDDDRSLASMYSRLPFADRPVFSDAQKIEIVTRFGQFLQAFPSASYHPLTTTPETKVRSITWKISEHEVMVDLDYEQPSLIEDYKMLYWADHGYRTIRIRADYVRDGSDWMRALEFAISRSTDPVCYLEADETRDSWAEVKARIGSLSSEDWWKINVGKRHASAADKLADFLASEFGERFGPINSPVARTPVKARFLIRGIDEASAQILIELDGQMPGSSDVYRALWALHAGHKIVRVREDHVFHDSFDWRSAIRGALGSTEDIICLEPATEICSWKPHLTLISRWRGVHPEDWRSVNPRV